MTMQTIPEMFQVGKLKDIPGYEGLYAASKDGRIWSYPNRRNKFQGMWMRQVKFVNTKNRTKPHSQYTVHLYKDKKYKNYQVHRLVAQTFIQNPDNLPQINHKDGNPLNNHISNIEWCDAKHNMVHAMTANLFDIHSGLQDKTRSLNGKKTGAINGMKSRRLFSMAEADCIRIIHKIGKKSCRAIAKVYGCSSRTISNICNNKSYLMEV